MAHVVYDAGTGTVVGASESVLVDIEALNRRMNVEDSDVLLSEEDDDAQGAASEIGVPVNAPVFMLACTGGLEMPTFEVVASQAAGEAKFKDYATDMLGDPGDKVHLLKIHNGVVTIVQEVGYEDDDD